MLHYDHHWLTDRSSDRVITRVAPLRCVINAGRFLVNMGRLLFQRDCVAAGNGGCRPPHMFFFWCGEDAPQQKGDFGVEALHTMPLRSKGSLVGTCSHMEVRSVASVHGASGSAGVRLGGRASVWERGRPTRPHGAPGSVGVHLGGRASVWERGRPTRPHGAPGSVGVRLGARASYPPAWCAWERGRPPGREGVSPSAPDREGRLPGNAGVPPAIAHVRARCLRSQAGMLS